MAFIVTRQGIGGKGSPLTNVEVDQNFININADLETKLTSLVSVPVNKGGLGVATLTAGAYLKGDGTNPVVTQLGIPASDITSGLISVARLGTGTANTTTFLRGDGTWTVIPLDGEIILGNLSGSAGSGSGLDADLLDGFDTSLSASNSTVAVRTNNGSIFMTNSVFPGSNSGQVTLRAVPTAGNTLITLPATNGTVVTTGDVGTVTTTMLAGSIGDGKLSTIVSPGKVANSATTASPNADANTIVSRDEFGATRIGIIFTDTPSAGDISTRVATTAFVHAKTSTLGTMSTQNSNNVNITGGTINGVVVGSNARGQRTVSTAGPSGGSEGDIWYQI